MPKDTSRRSAGQASAAQRPVQEVAAELEAKFETDNVIIATYMSRPSFNDEYGAYIAAVADGTLPVNIGSLLKQLEHMSRVLNAGSMLAMPGMDETIELLYSTLSKNQVFENWLKIRSRLPANEPSSVEFDLSLLTSVFASNPKEMRRRYSSVPFYELTDFFKRHYKKLFEIMELSLTPPYRTVLGVKKMLLLWTRFFGTLGGYVFQKQGPVFFEPANMALTALEEPPLTVYKLPSVIILPRLRDYPSPLNLDACVLVIQRLTLFEDDFAVDLAEKSNLIERASALFEDCIREKQYKLASKIPWMLFELFPKDGIKTQIFSTAQPMPSWPVRLAALEAKWTVPLAAYQELITNWHGFSSQVADFTLWASHFYRGRLSEEDKVKLVPLMVKTVVAGECLNNPIVFDHTRGLLDWKLHGSQIQASFDSLPGRRQDEVRVLRRMGRTRPISVETIKRFIICQTFENFRAFDQWDGSGSSGSVPPPAFSTGCATCGTVGQLKICQGCSAIEYCSRECQADDWKRHKFECAGRKE